jgi:predicted lipid-binding transport protein (Tim44 family)
VNISFNQAPAFIAHYVNQSEETYRNRKINIPRDDTNEFRAFDPDIHKRYNNTENIVVKNLYSKRVRDYLINKQREITNRNTISHVFLKYTTILFRFPK